MKVKRSFVTNSSSTNFIFMFEGKTKEDLFQILRKYPERFELRSEYGGNTDVEQVVGAIETVMKEPVSYLDPVSIQDIDQLIKNKQEELDYAKDTEYKEENKSVKAFWNELMDDTEAVLSKVKQAKTRSLKSYLQVQFGDNHGHVGGEGIGSVMDYEGRNIKLDEPDILLLTNQER